MRRLVTAEKNVYTKTFADGRAASTRRYAVFIAHLRAGHIPLLKAYVNHLEATVDPKVLVVERCCTP